MTDKGQQIVAHLATLESVRLIAARDGDPAELLEEIRRVLELDAPMNEEADDARRDGRAETAAA